MSKISEPLIEFKPKLPKLSKNEQAVLKLLVEAGRLIVPIYLEQDNQFKKGSNAYPGDIKLEEIEEAAKKDPSLLSPYTVVEREDGKLVATPYHIKYARFIKPIAQKLIKASEVTDNKAFGRALEIQVEALMEGTYEKAMAYWIKLNPYILDISIGPIEHFDYRVFSGKASYQSWVGVLDKEGTKRLNSYKSIILNVQRKALAPRERIENLDNIKAKTIGAVLLSGLTAKIRFVGFNLPMNVNWVEKIGSEVTIFNQVNDLRLKEEIMPVFNMIFSKEYREGFSFEDLRRGSLRYIALHELAHNYLHYKNSAKNLKDLLPPVYELSATLLGLKIAGPLLIKDRITIKQFESMIIAYICRGFAHFAHVKGDEVDKSRPNYTQGDASFLNYVFKSGALRRIDGMIVPNFIKIFVSLHELYSVTERLLSTGTRKEAEVFFKKYGQIKSVL